MQIERYELRTDANMAKQVAEKEMQAGRGFYTLAAVGNYMNLIKIYTLDSLILVPSI